MLSKTQVQQFLQKHTGPHYTSYRYQGNEEFYTTSELALRSQITKHADLREITMFLWEAIHNSSMTVTSKCIFKDP